jgi:predicted regulator of Ras-like GTPase activity (Roadblock/LC7/MglB family)
MERIASLLERPISSLGREPVSDRVTTADYFLLLSTAVETLQNSTPESRAPIYQSARNALITKLKATKPAVSKARIAAEQRALDQAIDRIEARATAPDVDRVASIPDAQFASVAMPISISENEEMPESQLHSMFAPRVVKERSMSRLDEINRVLRKLQSDSFGVEACALISEDGLMIASVLAANMEETRVAGMTATLLSLGGRASVELSRGPLEEVVVRGDAGYAVLVSAGRGTLLLALTNESSKLGLVFFDMREAVRSLQKVL